MAEAFRAGVGRESTRAEVKRLLVRYLELLPDTVRRSQGFRLLRGVPHGLDRLATRGHLLGLGTGNLRQGARIKLERARLWARFSFGGFGDDGETREDLIRLAAERGARIQDRPLVAAEVVVVGDTPLDVDAARLNGFRAVAVASKPGSRRALERCGAERVIDGLEEL